jgi:hypothetical protein
VFHLILAFRLLPFAIIAARIQADMHTTGTSFTASSNVLDLAGGQLWSINRASQKLFFAGIEGCDRIDQ